MKKGIISLAVLGFGSFVFGIPISASSVNLSNSELCELSDSEAKNACVALGKSASILHSLVPLFEKKDSNTKKNVRNLLDNFKKSSDTYTRNIGIYFGYLVDQSIDQSDKNTDNNSSDNKSTSDKNEEQKKDSSSSDKKEEKSSSSSSSEISSDQSTAGSAVVKDGSNAVLVSNTITVRYGVYGVRDVTYDVQGLNNTSVTLEIDGVSVDSTVVDENKILFEGLHESLSIGKHTLTVKANLDADSNDQEIEISKFVITDEYGRQTSKDLDVTKIVVKGYPTLTASTSSDDLIITITIPQDMDDDVDILGFLVNGEAVTASFHDQNVDLGSSNSLKDIISSKGISLAAGDSTEFRIQAARSSTLNVRGIIIGVEGKTYVIDDKYKNVGKWLDFKVTAHGDSLPSNYYGLVSSSNDTIITTN